MGVQLGRAAGDVHHRDRRALQRREAELHRLAGHHLAPVGARVDVAMAAGLVAELADVHLEDRDLPRAERVEPDLAEGILEDLEDE